MKVKFSKYSANGNDFVIFDDRKNSFSFDSPRLWERICHRRWGVGADGLLFLKKPVSSQNHFQMVYLNSDGREVEMCGNGARALVLYASRLGDFSEVKDFYFETLNSTYRASINQDEGVEVLMSESHSLDLYQLSDWKDKLQALNSYFINTGVPHCLFELDDIHQSNLMEMAREIRFDPRFPEGANVNFYKRLKNGEINVRTFERGVDAETYACGTGVVAIARYLSFSEKNNSRWVFQSSGGRMSVRRQKEDYYFSGDIFHSFNGELDLDLYFH